MGIVQKLDDLGRPAWIGLLVLSFILFWPAGLALLAFLIGSGRMRCAKHGGPGRWYRAEKENGGMGTWWPGRRQSSGNVAFDEYREETLRRLEEEQKEFRSFLDRLRHAKDKAEFDQFMADRGRRDQPETQPNS
jgi:hypothetical protein